MRMRAATSKKRKQGRQGARIVLESSSSSSVVAMTARRIPSWLAEKTILPAARSRCSTKHSGLMMVTFHQQMQQRFQTRVLFWTTTTTRGSQTN